MNKVENRKQNEVLGPLSLGQKIENARKSKRLSQVKLAELLGVSRASVSLYETNSGRPSYKVLEKLAEVLGVSFMDLAGLDYGSDDYPGVMITQHILTSTNDDRSAFIKEHLGRDETYTEVEFMGKPIVIEELNSSNVNQTIVSSNQLHENEKHIHIQWPSVSVLVMDGVNYSNARVYIVEDNKIGPRYPKYSRHILHPVLNSDSWRYLTGIHGLSIRGEATIIRRIVNNNLNELVLADAYDNKMHVLIKDIEMIWNVGQTIHIPPEEL